MRAHDTRESGAVREPFHYRYRNLFVGLFIFIPLVTIPGILIYEIVTSDFIQSWEHFSIRYHDIYGLQKGADVRYHGVKVGNVRYINLSSDGIVDVFIRVRQQYVGLLMKGCVAQLGQRTPVVGDWEIELKKRPEMAGHMRKGGRIPAQPAVAFDEAMQRMVRMVAAVDSAMVQLRAHRGVFGRLLQGDTLFDMITYAGDNLRYMMDRSRTLLHKADTMMETVERFGAHGYRTVDTLMVFARQSIALTATLHGLLDDITRLAQDYDDLPRTLQQTLEQIQKDAEQAEILLKGMQRHWFLKGAVNKARDAQQ